jgi:hypothetical protein
MGKLDEGWGVRLPPMLRSVPIGTVFSEANLHANAWIALAIARHAALSEDTERA